MIFFIDPEKRSFKGVAFGMCSDQSNLEKALTLNGMRLKGRSVKVTKASDKPNRN